MLNASVGFQRVLERVRRPLKHGPASDAPREARRFAVAPKLRHGVHVVVAASRLAPVREQRATVVAAAPVVVARTETPAQPRRTLISRLGHERSVAMVVVAIVVGASVISVSAGHPAGPTGNTNGAGTAPRIAIGGDTTGDTAADNTGDVAVSGGTGDGTDATDSTDVRELATPPLAPTPAWTRPTPRAASSSASPSSSPRRNRRSPPIDLGDPEFASTDAAGVEGPFIDDGTLVKPIAVDTTVPDGSSLVKTYKVKSGDTLADIATKFKVSPMTVVWANDLKSKTDFKKGDTLRIPPVTGLIVKVAATDTLAAIAARYDVNGTDILATNGIDDPNLVVGQVLVLPGAKGRAMDKPSIRIPNTTSTVVAAVVEAASRAPRRTPAASSSSRSSVATTTSVSTSTTAITRSTSQPTTARPFARPPPVSSPSPAGRATAAATRSGSPTAPGCTPPTTTCRRSRSGAASTSGVARRSAASASPATPQARTATSRSGVAPSGTAASA